MTTVSLNTVATATKDGKRQHVDKRTVKSFGSQSARNPIAISKLQDFCARLDDRGLATASMLEAQAFLHGEPLFWSTELNAENLLNRIDLPLEWPAQRNALGIK